jgi:hypothetical protein
MVGMRRLKGDRFGLVTEPVAPPAAAPDAPAAPPDAGVVPPPAG